MESDRESGTGGPPACVERAEAKNPTFQDLGGIDALLKDLKTTVLLPFTNPEPSQFLRLTPLLGILLHGPPGTGKTTLARAIANELRVPFYELISEISGASEHNIRQVFSDACHVAPSVVFIDHIDAIADSSSTERRILTQLCACIDASATRPVLVIGATDRVDAIDPSLRRSGRFDREIPLGIPDEKARYQILSVLARNYRVDAAVDLVRIARSTPGFVGADLAGLINKAGSLAMERIIDARKVVLPGGFMYAEDCAPVLSPEELQKLTINMADFEKATKLVQPLFRREGFFASPDVKWEDVGGLDSLRQELERCIVRRIEQAELCLKLGVAKGAGVLLYGPPGCGKTLIAKAVANEAGVNFMHIKGPEILNGYVGEHEFGECELALRTLFARARACSPCIIFIDEIDALMTCSDVVEGRVVQRVLTQLKVELDDERKDVHVIGATNRPEVMDEAILRPGLLGTRLYVPLPSPDERGLILKALARGKPIDASVDLMNLGRDDACKNFSGADLSALMAEALKEAHGETIKEAHFRRALEKVSPSISDEQIKSYDRLSKSFGAK